MVKYRTWTVSLKYSWCNFSKSAELRYFYLVTVANSVPNTTCLHPKDLEYTSQEEKKRKKLQKYDSVWKKKNSKSLSDSGTIYSNLQICPNLNRK